MPGLPWRYSQVHYTNSQEVWLAILHVLPPTSLNKASNTQTLTNYPQYVHSINSRPFHHYLSLQSNQPASLHPPTSMMNNDCYSTPAPMPALNLRRPAKPTYNTPRFPGMYITPSVECLRGGHRSPPRALHSVTLERTVPPASCSQIWSHCFTTGASHTLLSQIEQTVTAPNKRKANFDQQLDRARATRHLPTGFYQQQHQQNLQDTASFLDSLNNATKNLGNYLDNTPKEVSPDPKLTMAPTETDCNDVNALKTENRELKVAWAKVNKVRSFWLYSFTFMNFAPNANHLALHSSNYSKKILLMLC